VAPGNLALVSQQKPRRQWSTPQVISRIGCLDLMDRGASCFQLYRNGSLIPKSLFEPSHAPSVPNLSDESVAYLHSVEWAQSDAVFMHVVAVLHSPAYSRENAGALRQDWPRVPLPDKRAALERSAALGRQMAALLDSEAHVPGVTAGKVEGLLRTVGLLAKVGGGELDPNTDDFAVTAGWGHAGKGGVTMPAKGRVERRAYDKAELDAIGEAAKARGFSVKQALTLLGSNTCDVFLNDTAYWKNIPVNVWEYFIGGYQVIKKWLSYREHELLGRALRADEAREVTNIARRLTAILLLQPALDENYRQSKAHAYAWPAPAS
jgi:hypothetical protein